MKAWRAGTSSGTNVVPANTRSTIVPMPVQDHKEMVRSSAAGWHQRMLTPEKLLPLLSTAVASKPNAPLVTSTLSDNRPYWRFLRPDRERLPLLSPIRATTRREDALPSCRGASRSSSHRDEVLACPRGRCASSVRVVYKSNMSSSSGARGTSISSALVACAIAHAVPSLGTGTLGWASSVGCSESTP